MEGMGYGGGLSADSPENGYFTSEAADVHVNLAGHARHDPDSSETGGVSGAQVRFIPTDRERRAIG